MASKRCDGKRPICSPCMKRNRQDDCEYSNDSKDSGMTRMQRLESDITRLQNRVRELESANPGQSSSKGPPPSSSNVPELIPDRSASVLSRTETTVDTPLTISAGLSFNDELEPIQEMSPQTPTYEPEPQWWEREHPPDDISNML